MQDARGADLRQDSDNSRACRVFLDTEFTDLPWSGRSQLLWVGLAADDGSSWSALSAEALADGAVSPFVEAFVLPHITPDEPRLTRHELREAIIDFCGCPNEFWAWCPTSSDLMNFDALPEEPQQLHAQFWDWDFQLLRRVVDPWPDGWPRSLCDVQGLAVQNRVALPENPRAHHPVHDALWNREVVRLAAGGAPGSA